MDWLRIFRNAFFAAVLAFIISSIIMLFVNSRVNWGQQGTTAVLFFLGMSVVYFLRERKLNKPISKIPETPETQEEHE